MKFTLNKEANVTENNFYEKKINVKNQECHFLMRESFSNEKKKLYLMN